MLIGHEIALGVKGGVFVGNFPEPVVEAGAGGANFSRFPDDILAFLPKDAKKPAVFDVEFDDAKERMDEGAVPLLTVELDRVGEGRGGWTASDG